MALDQIRVYLGFSGILPHLVRMRGQKSIVFIHDFGFYSHPQYYKDPRKMIWQTEYALYGADRVIVFSDYIKDQIFTRFPEVSRKKVVRIYPGGDHIIKPKQATQIGGKFFLFVGVIKAAKNIELLLRYFSEFMSGPEDKETKLILIGPREDNYYKKICASPLYHKICANLLFLNDISDRELAHYYLNCQALLNVSHEEGFCYPVIEALRLGSHVIVNDLPLYREFKPNFERLHIEQNSRLFVNAMCKVAKKADPPEIANSPFTWSNFTRDLLKVIDEIIS
jgi:alpha-1,2-rhamnosyltransferase